MTTDHDLCQAARNVPCICGAPPGCPCVRQPRHYCLRRFQHAYRAGFITLDDDLYIIRNFLVDVTDPEEGAA